MVVSSSERCARGGAGDSLLQDASRIRAISTRLPMEEALSGMPLYGSPPNFQSRANAGLDFPSRVMLSVEQLRRGDAERAESRSDVHVDHGLQVLAEALSEHAL